MENKEIKAVISDKINKVMKIALIIYELVILLMGILGFVVDTHNSENNS